MNIEKRRLLVALYYLLCADEEDIDKARRNARKVLSLHEKVCFMPEIEGTSIDDYLQEAGTYDVYIDGVLRPDLEAVIRNIAILSKHALDTDSEVE